MKEAFRLLRFSNSLPKTVLLDHRRYTVGSECIVLLAEVVACGFSFHASFGLFWCVILADLLLLSPLKLGRVLLYDTATTDSSATSWHLLFRYYKHGYWKAVMWRFQLWLRIGLWSLMLSLPIAGLVIFQEFRVITDALIQTGISLTSFFISIATVVCLLLINAYYSPAAFIVLYTDSVSKAFHLRNQLYRRSMQAVLQPYWHFWGRLPFLLLIFPIPYFLSLFHAEQAIMTRKRMCEFLEKNKQTPCNR